MAWTFVVDGDGDPPALDSAKGSSSLIGACGPNLRL